MKKLNRYALFLLLILSGCSGDDFCNCLQRSGSTTTEYREVEPFSKIEMNDNIDLELIPDTTWSVSVTCGSNLIDGIATEVNGGMLKLRNKNKCNWLRDPKNNFKVRVHVAGLEYIHSLGTGDITCLDTLRHEPFLLESSNGTGNYHLLVHMNYAELKLHSGPADLYISGSATNIYFYSGANGFIHAEGLETGHCTVSTKSTGDCTVRATIQLDAEIEYSGDIYYLGAPQIHRTGNGTGQLKPL